MSDDDREPGRRTFEVARLKQVMGHFATGITIVTGLDANTPVGFTAKTFHSLSFDPALVMFCPQRSSTTWPRIEKTGEFCVNILAEDQESLARAFAASGSDKYQGVGWRAGPVTGCPILHGCLAWIEGRRIAEHDGGDHTVVISEVLDMGVEREGQPLVFYRAGFGRFDR